MLKHAYLLMIHKVDNGLKRLLELLDYAENDIYIHIDSKYLNFEKNELKKLVKESRLYFVKRTNVIWGDYSQVNAELVLLREAINNEKYAYYHLLSGEDLPIKSQKYIHHFFSEHSGKEFINFQSEVFTFENRVRYYHLLQKYVGRGGFTFINFLEKTLLYFQKIIRINRSKNIFFQKGANWFSITDNLARYVVKNEEWIRKHFKFTNCPDEIFLQTLVINSKFKDNLYHTKFDNSYSAIMRMIDWDRGRPYTFRISDFESIIYSDMLFCRKFQPSEDDAIIEKIFEWLQTE